MTFDFDHTNRYDIEMLMNSYNKIKDNYQFIDE